MSVVPGSLVFGTNAVTTDAAHSTLTQHDAQMVPQHHLVVTKQLRVSAQHRQCADLGLPLVSDQQVVGGEVPVHHVVAVHELHSCRGLMGQLQPDGPLTVQPEPWRCLPPQTHRLRPCWV